MVVERKHRIRQVFWRHPEIRGTLVEVTAGGRVGSRIALERQVMRTVRAGAGKSETFDRLRDAVV